MKLKLLMQRKRRPFTLPKCVGKCKCICRGPIGSTGPRGPIGHQGSRGRRGLAGLTGATGSPGIGDGITGITGPQGLPGAQGLQGLTGATGAQGMIPGTSAGTFSHIFVPGQILFAVNPISLEAINVTGTGITLVGTTGVMLDGPATYFVFFGLTGDSTDPVDNVLACQLFLDGNPLLGGFIYGVERQANGNANQSHLHIKSTLIVDITGASGVLQIMPQINDVDYFAPADAIAALTGSNASVATITVVRIEPQF
ncbi:collagen-like protein [Paenibacillus sp. N1-5-1-14]|uniref:collagen-like protein n=1 Tax=Paenibacillus radicibacter TaxID=2972488 RepID=UPI002158D7FB|nr:collagen-like protein [Paenibacillus radicibacter]MCR8642839.1 collagen-like protein [Paenibacillus radicibacter]